MIKEELFPVVNEKGEQTGVAGRSVCHGGSMLLHPVVHVHVFNAEGALYLQQRAWTKDIQPGKWDTAVGGHVEVGETIKQAVARECFEELNLQAIEPLLVYRYLWKSSVERELVYVHTLQYDGQITPHPTELAGGRFCSVEEIKQALGKGVFTPNFECDWQLLTAICDIH